MNRLLPAPALLTLAWLTGPVLTGSVLGMTASAATLPAMPAPGLSSVTLPIRVPLSSLQAAAAARTPELLAEVNQDQSFLGGLLKVNLAGQVRRSGPVTLTPDGEALLLSMPITARLTATPNGLTDLLTRDFSGSALVTARIVPTLSETWEAGVKVSADYRWTDPMNFELTRGVRVSVQPLVDPQIRAQLDGVTARIGQAVRDGANLRPRAEAVWAKLQQPWRLPLPEAAYATVTPRSLNTTPFRFEGGAAQLTVAATFEARAALGLAAPVTARPLPPLQVGPPDGPTADPGVQLNLPIALPYPELSEAVTRYAGRQETTLQAPLSPKVRINRIDLTPKGKQLQASANLTLRALGLQVGATVDILGTPRLEGRVLVLSDVTVHTRPSGLTQRLLGWLADRRVQGFLASRARVDTSPYLDQALGHLRRALPFTPTPGLRLSGEVRGLRLSRLDVHPGALILSGEVQGQLNAEVQADQLP